jgi:phage-related protein (TIGR01555 family)
VDFIQRLKRARTRIDGWYNEWTGLGTIARDKAMHTVMAGGTWLDDETLAALYHHDDIARTIVSIFPEEALRQGLGVTDPCAAKTLEDLGARKAIEEAATWGRLYGGGVIVMGTDDPYPAREPMPPGARVKWLQVYDKREVHREQVFSRGDDPSWGEASVFRIQPSNGQTYYVHRSRCLVFGGQKTAKREREQRQGWDASVLQAIYPVVRDLGAAYLALGNMMTDASQGVLKMRGLVAAMLAEDHEVITNRLNLIDMSRSVARSIFLDAGGDESYERLPIGFAGVPDVIDRFHFRVAAAARCPVTVLFGQAPAGLNATGASDIRIWYANVDTYGQQEIDPYTKRLCAVAGHPDVVIKRPPLWQETATEKTDRENKEAQTDKTYFDIGAVTPEEIFDTARVKARYPNARAELHTPAPVTPLQTLQTSIRNSNPALAEAMTNAVPPATHCEHGRANSCEWCGVERTRAFSRGPDGKDVWRIAWRALGSE